MSEKQIRDSCIRVRQVNDGDFEIQNNLLKDYKKTKIKSSRISKLEKKLQLNTTIIGIKME